MPKDPAEPDNPLWDFSLAVYGRDGVADACLFLQDHHGLDVNLLLACCWAGARGQDLGAVEMARLMAAVADWQREIVRPLRGVRRCLKTGLAEPGASAAALREAVKAQELAAERIEQQLLFQAFGLAEDAAREALSEAQRTDRAAGNLRTYCEVSGLALDEDDRAALTALLSGAFPEARPDAKAFDFE